MPLRDLNIGQNLALARGAAAICIPVYGAFDLFAQCLLGVLSHTEPGVPIIVCDDGNPDPRFHEILEEAATAHQEHELHYLRQPENVGFVENVNAAIAACAPADVVILNSDCIVAEGWFTSLGTAAYSESRIATATALTNAGTIVSIPHRNRPVTQLPHDLTLDRSAASVRAASLRLRPDIPTCVGHCVYIRRSAFELVGVFDPVFGVGYGEEVDFSQRCLLYGLRHVVADDVFVLHHQSASFGRSLEAVRRQEENHAVIQQRYPYYDAWVREVSEDPDSPLAQSLSIATSALRGPSVAIDGRCLGPTVTGTQLVTLGVIAALDTYSDVRLRVLVPDDLGPWVAGFLSGRPQIEQVRQPDLAAGLEPADVAHRPYQVTAGGDIELLRKLGNRLVLSQLDNIALRNPGYFPGYDEWTDYRTLNQEALSCADQVVFISRHAANDARALQLLPDDRISVVPPATDGSLLGLGVAASPPPEAHRLARGGFLLCLGTDFQHKNRIFAFRLLEALTAVTGFEGLLVLAGPKVAAGSSGGAEAEYLLQRPGLAKRILDIGAVDEPGKRWLYEHSAAVVYPTTYEGFGLTPFEAADAGAPCLFARHTSLAEVLPESAALLVPWDPHESARRAAPVLVAGQAREEHVRSIRIAGARFTNRNVARGLLEVYLKALRSPAPSRVAVAVEDVDRLKREAAHLRAEASALKQELGAIYDDPLNRGLIGPQAVLPPELRRPVLAVATRPMLRKTVTAAYRAGYVLRHGPGKNRKGAAK